MSTEQRENLEAILRRSAFPAVPDVNEQRRQLKAFLSAQQTAGIRTIPVLELRRAWPTLLRLAAHRALRILCSPSELEQKGGVELPWPVSL